MRVLLIEDEKAYREELARFLSRSFDLRSAACGREGLAAYRDWRPHAILLDLNLPDMDGQRVLEEIRRDDSAVVIIVLTQTLRPEEHLFESGANDFVRKGMTDRKGIESRIRRRLQDLCHTDGAERVFAFGEYAVNFDTRTVKRAGEPLHLRHKPLDLLFYLIRNRNRPLGYDEILADVWGTDCVVTEHSIREAVWHLRKELGLPREKFLITQRQKRTLIFEAP